MSSGACSDTIFNWSIISNLNVLSDIIYFLNLFFIKAYLNYNVLITAVQQLFSYMYICIYMNMKLLYAYMNMKLLYVCV